MAALFLGEFSCPQDVAREFDVDLTGRTILVATYDESGYDGYAFVLFREGGKLYEVNASHCSCHGLRGEWEPEEASIAELLHRSYYSGSVSDPADRDVIRSFLGRFA